MKKLILAVAIAMGISLPAYAWDLGNGMSIDNSMTASYNVDTPATTLVAESGMTVPLLMMDLTVDSDWDLTALGSSSSADFWKGIDIGLDYDISHSVVLELNTGIDTNWNREDVTLSMTLSF